METMPTPNLDPQMRRIEADVFSRMAVIFRRCQHLVGFTLQDSTTIPDDPEAADGALFVSDIQFSRRVTEDEDDEVCRYIHNTVAELLAEREETLDLLKDRTFARTLH